MDWKNIAQKVGKVAPMIGTLLAPATGGTSIAIGSMVASVLGVENTPEAIHAELSSNPDALLKLKQLEYDERDSIRKMIIEQQRMENEKFSKAHDSYQIKNEMADHIAEQVIKNNLPIIALLVIVNIAVVYYLSENATLIAIASNVIGVAMGHLFNERQAVVNFFFGSSLGSKEKTKHLNEIKKQ